MAAYVFDEFVFDDVRYQLARAGAAVKADAQVLELLAHLLKNPGRVITKEELIEEIWQGRARGDNVISVCVAKLRKVLGGASNGCIGNVYGRGYRFMRPVTRRETSLENARSQSKEPPLQRAESSLVGRQPVMSQLEAALASARTGRGKLIALLGEAGIGKTRLAESLEANAPRQGFGVAWGHCHPFRDVPPLWPLLQVLRAWGVQLPAAASAPDTELLDDDPGELYEREPTQEAWHQTVLAMTDAWTKTCALSPQLIVLEDIQWADSASLRWLSYLMATVAQLPVLVVLTVRDTQLPQEPRTRRALDYVLGHRDCTRIALSRLSERDVEAYVTALFGTSDAALTEAVFAKSEGNPFFMVELLRPFADGEKPEPSELKLSGPALDIVRQALQQVSPETHAVLDAAAVIGRSFDVGLLSLVTDRAPDALLEVLEPAMSSHVIIAQRDSSSQFAFGHDLIRDVLYEDLSSIKRARLHLKVADGLHMRASSSAAPASTELAHHLLSALPAGDLTRAISVAQEAARAATHIGAYADACVLLRRAREALHLRPEIAPRTVCELLYDLGRFERAAGEPGFAKNLDQAVALARRHGIAEVLVAASQLVSGPPGTWHPLGGAEALEAALQALPEREYAQRSILLSHLTWTTPYSWDGPRVRSMLGEAHELAKAAGNVALSTLSRAHLYYSSGPDDLESVLEIADNMGRFVGEYAPRQRARWSLEPELTRVIVLAQRGEMSLAKRALDAFGAAARGLRHAQLTWHYERLSAIMSLNAGDFEWARERLDELQERAMRLQLHGRQTIEYLDRTILSRLTTPQPAAAGGLASRLRPSAKDGPLSHAIKLRLLTQFGLLDDARAELTALSPERMALLPKSRDYLAVLGHFAYAAVHTRALDHAHKLYELLSPYPRLCMISLSMHCHGTVARALGGLAAVLGRPVEASQHYELAIADSERYGQLPQLAETRYEYAQFLAGGDAAARQRSHEYAASALELAQQLGMKPLIIDCERSLSLPGQTLTDVRG